ncbi:hypothetical protein CVT24_008625 [Panaeolus cyanescens]|uniref:C2H2-type domain-containing protein n=1 Tax=Panaeolus cyanescens TaxID=181874 RepID=A0A409VET8_9AGAR|nr:hypothetical protein CVT24_008625 [Panaeolus cyanescens]
MNTSKTGSPYISVVDVVPPSPPREHYTELDHQSPFEYPTSPPLDFPHSPPYNPSYNGSYHNSPFSAHSELSFTQGEDLFDLLDNMPSIVAPYEPGEYDGPEQSNALQMYQDYTDPTSDFMSPHFSSGLNDQHRTQGSPFDHSSPASSNGAGGDNDGQQGDNRSRASSVASNRAPSQSPQPAFQHSPRMDMAASFNNISIHTPNWGTQPLPTHSPNLQSRSPLPQSKPHSPPRLRMPDGILDSQNQLGVPTINAPDGTDDDMMGGGPGGPSLHIVPATPVSGGAAGRANVPFQQTLATLNQGSELGSGHISSSNSDSGLLDGPQQQNQQPRSREHSPFRFPTQNDQSSNVGSDSFVFPDTNPQQGQQQQQGQNRARTISDSWNQAPGNFMMDGVQNMGNAGGIGGTGLGLFEYQSQHGQQQGQAQQQHRAQMQAFTFGGNPNNNLHNPPNTTTATHNNQLLLPVPEPIRRSVSDTSGSRMAYHRQSRSEDSRLATPFLQQQQQGQNQHLGHTASNSTGGFNFPGTEFLAAPQQQQSSQFLHPHHLPAPGSSPSAGSLSLGGVRSVSPGPGHYRRASSGSRSERGAGRWVENTGDVPLLLAAPRRVSPYPSPNASPRLPINDLEPDPTLGGLGLGITGVNMRMGMGMQQGAQNANQQFGNVGNLGVGVGISQGGMMGIEGIGETPNSAGFEEQIALTSHNRSGYPSLSAAAVAAHTASGGGVGQGDNGGGSRRAESVVSGGNVSLNGTAGGTVAKQNVTTGRTANASLRRRKQDATFVCTVPGCGSTFTRGFNLKGHLRSHFEQKPYKCHWPGCGKGFARQHDCKRHEQLHSNFRPFECEGCRKQFARMDALNRHLRSEAGGECAKIVEGLKGSNMGLDQQAPATPPEEGKKFAPRRRNTGSAAAQMDDEWSSVAL